MHPSNSVFLPLLGPACLTTSAHLQSSLAYGEIHCASVEGQSICHIGFATVREGGAPADFHFL